MELTEDLQEKVRYLGITGVILVLFIGLGNVMTPDPVEVGPVELDVECTGIEAGICWGFKQETHTTYNYDNYTTPEEGSEDYFRKAEAELMLQAYNICDGEEITGMDWVEHAEYEDMTGDEWLEKDEITLLECEETFYREMEDNNTNIFN